MQDLSCSSPLYSVLTFRKTTSRRSYFIKSINTTSLASHKNSESWPPIGKQRRKSVKSTSCTLILRRKHSEFEIWGCDLFSPEHGLVTMPPTDARKHSEFEIWGCDLFSPEHGLVTMPPTDASMMSRHLSLGVQTGSLKSNGIGDTLGLATENHESQWMKEWGSQILVRIQRCKRSSCLI